MAPPEQQKKLDPLLAALVRLAENGLTASGVIAHFQRRRVLPLMERRLALYKMVAGADTTCSAMAAEPLTDEVALQRAKRAVDRLAENPWVPPMRPEEGYLSLVSARLCFVF